MGRSRHLVWTGCFGVHHLTGMKKKSPRGIPDFSSKGPKSAMDRFLKDKQQQPKPQTSNAPQVKPQATSQKSGRRGA